jgi:hypothetical protein
MQRLLNRSSSRSSRGQALILVVLVMTVVFVVGAIAVDIGLWLSERRGAQTDADFPALAGAWELLPPNPDSAAASAAVSDWAADNNEQANLALEDVVVDDSCWDQGPPDAVTVDVSHDTRTLFAGLLGVADVDVGAHAKACAGAAQGVGNLIPFQMQDDPGPCFDTLEQPVFTSFCPLELGAQGSNPDRGMLDLQAPDGHCSDAPGAGDIEELIEWGAPGVCLINTGTGCPGDIWDDCVVVQSGDPKNVLDGVNARLLRDGDCDSAHGDGDGVDEFDETVELVSGSGPTGVYQARDCDPATEGSQISSRIVTIVVLETEPIQPYNQPHPILAFAGFYLLGCAPEGVFITDQSQTDPYCDAPGPVGCDAPGQCVVCGRFVKLILSGQGGVGAPNEQTTIFGIGLVE